MSPPPIVLESDRHLKWRSFDRLEYVLMILCGVCLTGFTISTFIDVVTRETGHPLLWLQEVTSAFFTYGVFVGSADGEREGAAECESGQDLDEGGGEKGFHGKEKI